ncbi:MAG: phage tail assembly protein T [Shewanella sp.]
MSARELDEWVLFSQKEPIGGLRSDYAAAQVARVVAAQSGSSATLEDFMPFHPVQIEKRERAEQERGTGTAAEFAAMFGGKVIQK